MSYQKEVLMKALFVSAAAMVLLSASGAQAEEWLRCTLTGSSDGAASVFKGPRRVRLEEAGSWELRENGKAVPGIEVRSDREGIRVNFDRIDGRDVVRSEYFFDDRRCDGEETGSATLSKMRIGAADDAPAQPPVRAVYYYDCSCGVD
jgi:hypothetical protein